MDFFQIALLMSMIIGILLLVTAMFVVRSDSSEKNNAMSYLEVDNTIKAIDASVNEADKVMEELSQNAKNIFKEMDGKYQELLFLYNLIDEKKKELAQIYSSPINVPKNDYKDLDYGKSVKTDIMVDEHINLGPVNPKFKSIMELVDKGMSIPDIAKKLDMGQGEIKLILELGNVR